ncbi:MAG TPA: MarR family transcriptional regulator [Acidimicrobiales bacterium]|nr:MarR family transcriptional regulator [Acidimicrobiales bacterium]
MEASSDAAGIAASLEDDDYRELLRLRTGLRRFQRVSEGIARTVGISPMQHQLLLAVRGHEGSDGPTIGEAAAHLLIRHNSAVELVDRAAAAGLVTRVADARDARAVRITLTERGAAVLTELTVQHRAELQLLATLFRSLATRPDERWRGASGPAADGAGS